MRGSADGTKAGSDTNAGVPTIVQTGKFEDGSKEVTLPVNATSTQLEERSSGGFGNLVGGITTPGRRSTERRVKVGLYLASVSPRFVCWPDLQYSLQPRTRAAVGS